MRTIQRHRSSAVVGPTIKIDGQDAEVKTVEKFEKLTEDIAGDVASDQLANRQRVRLLRTRA